MSRIHFCIFRWGGFFSFQSNSAADYFHYSANTNVSSISSQHESLFRVEPPRLTYGWLISWSLLFIVYKHMKGGSAYWGGCHRNQILHHSITYVIKRRKHQWGKEVEFTGNCRWQCSFLCLYREENTFKCFLTKNKQMKPREDVTL